MKHTLIDTSTAQLPMGLPTQRILLRQPVGPFAGRLLLVYQRTPSALAMAWASAPYTSWSAPGDIVSDADDVPFSAVIDPGTGNVHTFYTQSVTGAMVCRKLLHLNGAWAPQSPVTVYDSASSTNRYPAAIRDSYDRIWVVWTRDDSGTVSLRVKSSTDDGATFGSGSSDAGTDLSGIVTSGYPTLAVRPTHIHCLYAINGTSLRHRSIHIDAGLWNSAEVLYSGTELGSGISAGAAPDGTVGVLFTADGRLYLKEYDGAVWGALQTVLETECHSPSLRHAGNTPYCFFLQESGADQYRLFETHRQGATFVTPQPVLSQQTPLTSVFCLDADAPTPFADLTAFAESTSGGDIYHPTSGGLLSAENDALYLGNDDRIAFIRILLSQNGAGGVTSWEYWNGSEWTTFVPASGAHDFSAANAAVQLFADGNSSPADWQKTTVNGSNRFWIRARCTQAFTTAPIGSQLTAVPNITHVALC